MSQKLFVVYTLLALTSLVFFLESWGEPGWKTGVALLLFASLSVIEFFIDKSKLRRVGVVIFGLMILFFALKNFMAH